MLKPFAFFNTSIKLYFSYGTINKSKKLFFILKTIRHNKSIKIDIEFQVFCY